jgi:hypothetical protein
MASSASAASEDILLCQEVSNPVPPAAVIEGLQQCECANAKLFPHKKANCAIGKVRNWWWDRFPSHAATSATSSSAGNDPTMPSSGTSTSTATLTSTLTSNSEVNRSTESLSFMEALQNFGASADQEEADDDTGSDNEIDADHNSDNTNNEDDSTLDDGIVLPTTIPEGMDPNLVSLRRCTCPNSKYFPHRAMSCALAKAQNLITGVAVSLVGDDVEDTIAMNERCTCLLYNISRHRRKKCLLLKPAVTAARTGLKEQQAAKAANDKDLQQRERQRLQTMKSITFGTLFAVAALGCFLAATCVLGIKFARFWINVKITPENLLFVMSSWILVGRWTLNVLVAVAMFASVYHRILGYLLGLILRRLLGGRISAPRSFNITINWVALRIGFDVLEVVVDNFEWVNPLSSNNRKYQLHKHFVRVKHLRVSACPTRLLRFLLYRDSSIKVHEISVDGIEVNLEKMEDGLVYNFQEAVKLPELSTSNKQKNPHYESNSSSSTSSNEHPDTPTGGIIIPRIELSRLVVSDLIIHDRGLVPTAMGDNEATTLKCPIFFMNRQELMSSQRQARGIEDGANSVRLRPVRADKLGISIVLKLVLLLVDTNKLALSALLSSGGASLALGLIQELDQLMKKLRKLSSRKKNKDSK